ncbi:MAG TPA: hypothetical protein VK816_11105 [Jatrophihabitantaceae bacterium]|nr:hypothetical protein [Jatrophihabitantaceae bacterium]
MSRPAGSTASASSAPAVPPAAAPAVSVRSTFQYGALTDRVSAGGRVLVIRYWTTQAPADWSGSVPPVVQFSAQLAGGDADHGVRLTRVLATLGRAGATGRVLINDTSQPVLTPPYSYGNVLQLPAATPATDQLSVEFDVLIQTAPGAATYYREVYLDILPLSTREVS